MSARGLHIQAHLNKGVHPHAWEFAPIPHIQAKNKKTGHGYTQIHERWPRGIRRRDSEVVVGQGMAGDPRSGKGQAGQNTDLCTSSVD